MSLSVKIEPFDEVIEVDSGESVLSAILRNGKFVRYGCKHGGCGTCRARLVKGGCSVDESTSFALSDEDRTNDIVLLCSTYPSSSEVSFDVSGLQDLTSEEFHAGGNINEYVVQVQDVVKSTRDIYTLKMRLEDSVQINFDAGQYIEIAVPNMQDTWRSYSISSSPKESDVIELVIKSIPGGCFSSLLDKKVKAGDILKIRGPIGQFFIRLSHRPIIMMAIGSGIGPIISMVKDLIDSNNERRVSLFYGAKTEEDLLMCGWFNRIEKSYGWFKFIPVLSVPSDCWNGEEGRITNTVEKYFASGLRGYEGYLCGSPAMIDSAIGELVRLGCKDHHIFFDRFVPSG